MRSKYVYNNTMRRLTLLFASIGLVMTAYSQPNVTPKEWGNNEYAGIWKLSVGTPEKINLLSELDITPKKEALQQMAEGRLPISPADVKTELRDGKTYISFPLEKGRRYSVWGLTSKLSNNGAVSCGCMWIITPEAITAVPMHRFPFFVSSRGYGVLINSARYIDLWVGTAVRKGPNAPEEQDRNTDPTWPAQPYSDNIEVLVPAQGVELVFLCGANHARCCSSLQSV